MTEEEKNTNKNKSSDEIKSTEEAPAEDVKDKDSKE